MKNPYETTTPFAPIRSTAPVMIGSALDEPTDLDCFESPRITFFLAELWDYSEEDYLIFDEEVRITYIHEFGHYLGLGESELEVRGPAITISSRTRT